MIELPKPLTVVFFGRSGSGKGTQAKLLLDILESQKRSVSYIETGNEFRQFVSAPDNLTAQLTKQIIDRGDFVPAFLPIWVWAQRLITDIQNVDTDIILDGLARRMHEAPILDSALSFYNRAPVFVIHLNVSREWSRDHLLSRGRTDDTVEKIENRLNAFEHDVPHVLEYFAGRKGYHVITVNGEQLIEQVHHDVLAGIIATQFEC